MYTRITIDTIKKLGLKITWKLLSFGYFEQDYYYPIFAKEDIIDYAYKLLEEMESDFCDISSLIYDKNNTYEFNIIFKKLANDEKTDTLLEMRKWKVCYIVSLLKKEEPDYISGIHYLRFAIIEFNIAELFPAFKAREYYTIAFDYSLELYEYLKDKTNEWLKKEIAEIISIENNH